MTKPKPKPTNCPEAIQAAINREMAKRQSNLKPIEIVKIAISAYQAYSYAGESNRRPRAATESEDRIGLRRGIQASIDRLLFNVNYWRSAYEDRIIAACSDPDDAQSCLRAIATWNTHTMKLNKLSDEETAAALERFCPPLAINNRHGGKNTLRGKGPVLDFRNEATRIIENGSAEDADALNKLIADIEAEASLYEEYEQANPLDALYELLPCWCLQDTIDLVRGTWWDDYDVMMLIAMNMNECFHNQGRERALCDYFIESFQVVLDDYLLCVSTDPSEYSDVPLSELRNLIRSARMSNPNCETDGYGETLPSWLSPKEQLIWNTIVCAIYGPMHARPLLADAVSLLPVHGKPANLDIITDLAQRAYTGYLAVRRASGISPEYGSFDMQPQDLRNSSFERIENIPSKLDVLGYRIVPVGSCYPEEQILSLTPSEIECLAILEHRRWLEERKKTGWTYSPKKEVAAKTSPYMVNWEELPDRAREWNRSSIRDIPALLSSAGLAIIKK